MERNGGLCLPWGRAGHKQHTQKQLPTKMYTAQLENFRHISNGNITCFPLFFILFFFYHRQKAGQWCKRKQLYPDPGLQAISHVTVLALLSLRQGEQWSACHCQLTGTQRNGHGHAGQFLFLLLPAGGAPGDPASPPTEPSPAFLTAVTNSKLQEGSLSQKGHRNHASSVRHSWTEKRTENNTPRCWLFGFIFFFTFQTCCIFHSEHYFYSQKTK